MGNYSTILTSPDAITWKKSYSNDSNEKLYGISWSGQQYVAVGRDSIQDKTIIMTSPDGDTWTKNSFAIAGGELKSVAWSGNLFMAVGNKTMDPCCRTPKCICGFWPIIITSVNGHTWENHSPVGTSMSGLHNIIWDGSRFVIAGGYFKLVTTDGITWKQNSDYYSTNVYLKTVSLKDLSYIGIGPAVGYEKDMVFTSDDGLNWSLSSAIEQNIPVNSLTDIVWSGRKYVVSGLPGYMYVSPY